MTLTVKKLFSKKRILITGASGFLGFNLIRNFSSIDCELILQSRNVRKIKKLKSYRATIKIFTGSLEKSSFTNKLVRNVDYIFHFSGHSGATASMDNPQLDLRSNCLSALNLLDSCRRYAPQAKLVFAGSRLEYGIPKKLPVTEQTPFSPNTIYGIHKLTISHYVRLYAGNFGLKAVYLRFPNLYGPHKVKDHLSKNYNIINYFIDQLLLNKPISIYGSGRQTRDYLYVDDAINAMFSAITNPKAYGQVINIGTGKEISFKDAINLVYKVVGKGKVKYLPWPPSWKDIETGNFSGTYKKAKALLNWRAGTKLKEGIFKTVSFQRKLLNQK